MASWERQRSVLDQLKSDQRSCSLYSPDLLALRQSTPQEVAHLPWGNYILFEMPKAAERDGYEIHINPHRSSPWVPYSANLKP